MSQMVETRSAYPRAHSAVRQPRGSAAEQGKLFLVFVQNRYQKKKTLDRKNREIPTTHTLKGMISKAT